VGGGGGGSCAFVIGRGRVCVLCVYMRSAQACLQLNGFSRVG